MKILFTHRPGGAYGYITEGWINACNDSGIETRRWDGKLESWDNFDPDLYIGCSGHKQPIPVSRRTKVAIHTNCYGPGVKETGVNENEKDIQWVKDQNPDCVFGYAFEEDSVYWQHWKDCGLTWSPMATAADITQFNKSVDFEDKKFRWSYVGGRWGYKAKTIDKFLFPLIKRDSDKLDCLLYGWGEWPKDMGVMMAEDEKVPMIFGSSKVAPCISELHTHNFGFDIPERIWKTAACGALPISDPVIGIQKHIPGIPVGKTPDEYLGLVCHYSNNDVIRKGLVSHISNHVRENHTYHNRMSVLLENMGFEEESKKLLERLKHWL